MKQQEMIDSIHEELGGAVSKVAVHRVLSAVAARVTKAIAKGGDCVIPGVGVVKLSTRKGRAGVLQFGAAAGQKYKTRDSVVPRMSFYKAVRLAAAKNKPKKS